MTSRDIDIAGQSFRLDLTTAPQERLDTLAGEVTALFLKRETEFGVNPAVRIVYPDTSPDGEFLTDPVDLIARLSAEEGQRVSRVVVLTTWGAAVHDALVTAGFEAHRIDMPAGPDDTWAFLRGAEEAGAQTLYVEAVNEADEKIRPSYVLRLLDEKGEMVAGACGSIHARDGRRYAYLAMMAVAPGLPLGTGSRLVEALAEALRGEGVGTVHLGTQTAGPFYEANGFRVTLRLVPRLRWRPAPDGGKIWHDLVMMARDL
ncbi:MAG: GNAT family N-acetyltransferase [Rhodobacterales bacterium]|nr:GNAT family N-acetyltransferase [Rhodobacterales bacterium]